MGQELTSQHNMSGRNRRTSISINYDRTEQYKPPSEGALRMSGLHTTSVKTKYLELIIMIENKNVGSDITLKKYLSRYQ